MSTGLETAAEVLKLARLLDVPTAELDYLDKASPQQLRSLREGITDRIFSTGARSLQRIGAAARLLPSAVIAPIAQRAFGPLLCARAAGAVDPAKAVDVATRLPADFLADVTVQLDPRRVADIIAKVPRDLVVPVSGELGRREEHVTMGRFLAFVPDDAVAAAIGELSDEALLRTAFVLEHKDRLDHALGLLPSERLPGIIRSASELGLWPEALDLLDHLSDRRRGPIADVVSEQDPLVLARLVEAAAGAGLWESLLPVVGMMSEPARLRLAAQPAFHEPQMLKEIVHAAAASSLWGDVLPLIEVLPAEARLAASNLVGTLPDDDVDALVLAVADLGLWEVMLPLVRSMPADAQRAVARAPAFHEEAFMRDVLTAAAHQGLWVDLLPMLDSLPPESMASLSTAITTLEDAAVAAVRSDDPAQRDALTSLIEHLPDEVGEAVRQRIGSDAWSATRRDPSRSRNG